MCIPAGSCLGPVVLGRLLDGRCSAWRETCGRRLSCWLYDHQSLVTALFCFMVATKLVSVMFCWCVLVLMHFQQ